MTVRLSLAVQLTARVPMTMRPSGQLDALLSHFSWTSGQFRGPPTGRFSWPLSIQIYERLPTKVHYRDRRPPS